MAYAVYLNLILQPANMKKILFSSDAIWTNQILALMRIVVGIFMIYHGVEVFDKTKMNEYAQWDFFKNMSSGTFLAYLGKGAEFVGGVMLTIGFMTRIACVILAGTMLFVAFVLGHGKIWYEDQYPFLFVLLAIIFFFAGPGSWSVDKAINYKKNTP